MKVLRIDGGGRAEEQGGRSRKVSQNGLDKS